MKLITAVIRKKLEKNFKEGNHEDIALKLFNPCGGETWLITQLSDNGDTMTGLCDLGHGFSEYGDVSLNEIESLRLPWGMKIERDRSFRGGKVVNFKDRKTLAGC